MAEKFRTGPSFTMHVPVHPFGTDPSQTNKAVGQPNPIRQTEEFQWVSRGNGSGFVGLMTNTAGIASAAAAIVVVQANCVPGEHLIRVGKFELRPGVDFAVGINDVALAANLAAAILALPGYTGVTDGVDTVTLGTTTDNGSDHNVEVHEWGAASAFTLGALDREGYMDRGDPEPEAPLFT